MKMRASICGVVLLFTAGGAGAEIYRCSAAGSVTYQEVPCPAAAAGGSVAIPTSFPDANTAERDRILPLDARLLKRAEIDASERIARDDRIARERTLQALLERERAEPSPVFVVARPLRHNPRRAWPIAIR